MADNYALLWLAGDGEPFVIAENVHALAEMLDERPEYGEHCMVRLRTCDWTDEPEHGDPHYTERDLMVRPTAISAIRQIGTRDLRAIRQARAADLA